MKTTATAASFLRTANPVLINSPKRDRSCQTRPPIEMSPTLTPMSASSISVACIAFAMVKKATLMLLADIGVSVGRSEEHTSELQSHSDLVCRLLLEKKKKTKY